MQMNFNFSGGLSDGLTGDNKVFSEISDTLQKFYNTDFMSILEEFCQGETKVLLYVFMNASGGEQVYPTDISRDLCVSKQRVTSVLNSLEKKNMVELVHSKQDRRKIQVSITLDGIMYLADKKQKLDVYLDYLVNRVGVEALLDISKKMSAVADGILELENQNKVDLK